MRQREVPVVVPYTPFNLKKNKKTKQLWNMEIISVAT
jgi:hypothetical protein